MDIILNSDKQHWYYSLRWKLFVTYLFVGLFPLILFFVFVSNSISGYFIENRKKELLTNANVLSSNLSKQNYLFDQSKKVMFDSVIDESSRTGGYRILVTNKQAIIVNDSNKTEIGKTYVVPEVVETFNKNSSVKLHRKEKTIYASTSIENENSEKTGVVLIVASIEDIYIIIDEIQKSLIVFAGISSLMILVFVFYTSKMLIDPLNKILKVIKKMSIGHLDQRIQVSGNDEFKELSDAFNDMTEKLSEVEQTRDEFVSNVSHELKTPLSSIKVLSESILLQDGVPIEMYVEFLQDINSEVDRMADIVSDLLTLVKLDQREVILNVGNVNLNLMIEDILKRLYPLAEVKNIEVLYEAIKKVNIEADEMKLCLAISNLVENGIKYTLNGGSVKVTIDADHQNAYITVADTGIGIEEKEQNKIFTRFYRVDKTRDRETGGTGLGLAITHSTIILHNGSIRLSSKVDEGTTFVVRIPLKNNKENN